MNRVEFKTPVVWPRTKLRIPEIWAEDGFTVTPTPSGLQIRSAMGEEITVPWGNVVDGR